MKATRTNRVTNAVLLALGVFGALAVVATGVSGLRNDRLAAAADPHAGHAHAAVEEAGAHAGHDHAKETADAHEAAGDACCPSDAVDLEAGHAEDEARLDEHGHEAAAHAGHDEERDARRAWCGEHALYADECAICSPDRTASLKPGESMKLRLSGTDVLDKAGVDTAKVSRGSSRAETQVLCKVAYNEGQLAHIAPLVSGSIRKVLADLGDTVQEGAALVELSSPEVAEAKGAYLSAVAEERLAIVTHKREKELWEKKISPAQDYEQAAAALAKAQARVRTAQQGLLNVGLSSAEIRAVQDKNDAGSITTLRAPFTGTLVERHAVIGETVDRGAMLFMLADLKDMWVELAVPSALIAGLNTGDTVRAEFEGLDGFSFDGVIDWLDTRLDESNRTLRARAVVSNEDGRLKHGMFGKVHIAAAGPQTAVVVPTDAVQHFEGAPVLFVKLDDDLFEVRRVALGPKDGGHVAVVDGVKPGEEFVVARSFTVKSEFLKERLGMGCAEH